VSPASKCVCSCGLTGFPSRCCCSCCCSALSSSARKRTALLCSIISACLPRKRERGNEDKSTAEFRVQRLNSRNLSKAKWYLSFHSRFLSVSSPIYFYLLGPS
jgi:hypothetical protein